MTKPIRKVVVANRGEIAVRIMRTAKARGVSTVAVFSDADKDAYHVRFADEAIHIGGSPAKESYLNIEAIIDAARNSHADAIHPGYGFLSERADFAKACKDAGVIFIGPPPEAISAMGDKAESKRRMIEAGVPCIPGYQGEDQSEKTLVAEAGKIGYPVMIKASAGGGGRGMRIVETENDLVPSLTSARKEAESAFGDGRVLLERAVIDAHHVEIQVFADAHGSVIHLGERDCSLQRRNQKVIEESPSPVINDKRRAAMGSAAVKAAKAVGYVGAGTVEFLYDKKRDEFYFLEMNTRLQVEHPVTELVTGLDLVALQFDVAEGKQLSFSQKDVSLDGWAIEARLYAEDPSKGFLPQTGCIADLWFPKSSGIRIDNGVETGDGVSAYYDPMIAKVIAYGATRSEAIMRLSSALQETVILGVTTNRGFLIRLIEDDAFIKGDADTGYIERHLASLTGDKQITPLDVALAAAVSSDFSIGHLLSGFNSRSAQFFPLKLSCDDRVYDAFAKINGRSITGKIGPDETTIEIQSLSGSEVVYIHNNNIEKANALRRKDEIYIDRGRAELKLSDITYRPADDSAASADSVIAPLAGAVTGVHVKKGDMVSKGQIVITIEAMKMEHQLKAPRNGSVSAILVTAGDQVSIRAKVLSLETEGLNV